MLNLIENEGAIVLIDHDGITVAAGDTPEEFVESLFDNEGDSFAQDILIENNIYIGINPFAIKEIKSLIADIRRGDSPLEDALNEQYRNEY